MAKSPLVASALALSVEDKLRLVEMLLESIPADTEEIDDKELANEVRRRSDEIDVGSATMVSWSDLKSEPI